MPDWVTYLVVVLTSVASAVAAMSTILKPIKKQMNDIVEKEIEKEKEEQRMQKLEGWTGNQQEDIEEFNKGLVILAEAVEALLDHAIVKQEGNGKCHAAQNEVNAFLREKSLSKKSHK